jgi:hypothetical protein
MKLQRFEVSNTPHLTITCHGDLDVNGGREGEVAVKVYGQEDELQAQREGEHITIEARARCKVGCPRGTSLTLQSVNGDVRVRRVDGPIAAENAQGDVVLKEVGPTTISNIGGDVRVRSVSGDLRLELVGGDLSVRGVEGLLSCDQAVGDLSAAYLEGGLDVTVGGDGALRTDFTPGCDYRLRTTGDAAVKFPTNASARFQISANGDISHKVDWAELEEGSGSLSGQVGEGEANVEISAGGDAALRSRSESGAYVFSFDLEEEGLDLELESMAEEIERNIEGQMARLNAQLEAQLSRIDHEAIRRRAEQAAEKVRVKAERAAERARMQAERAQRRWERMEPRRPTRPQRPTPPGAPPTRPTREPVSEEERLMVLRLVQEGKISSEEAARLLEAMEV